MTVFAQGKKAWGECARSGKKMLLRDMVTDPLTNLLVDPDWAEPPLMRPPIDITDGIALERPAPDLDAANQNCNIIVGRIVDLATDCPMAQLWMKFNYGNPAVTTT